MGFMEAHLVIPIGDTEKINRFPWMNYFFILANIGFFVYAVAFCKTTDVFFTEFGFIPSRFFEGNWNPIQNLSKYIPLISANFIHGGYLHIIGNMLFLYIFGDNIEDRIGHIRYFFFYILCAVISLLVYGYAFKTSSQPVLGASGAIAGSMGAFYILYPRAKIKTFFGFFVKEIPAIYFLFIWFLFNLVRGFLDFEGKFIEPVAWWAHIGGFIGGALLINLLLPHSSAPGSSSGKSKKRSAGKPKKTGLKRKK